MPGEVEEEQEQEQAYIAPPSPVALVQSHGPFVEPLTANEEAHRIRRPKSSRPNLCFVVAATDRLK